MQSRKDQVQAYFFVVGRLFSALTHGKPDILEPPTRRFSTGATLGVLLAGLLVGIFWIVGFYAPGTSTAWQRPGTIIVDKNTGARFLFLEGRLRPVLNFTSAKLAAAGGPGGAGQGGTVEQVSAKSLAGVPVGMPIGIPGAPDAIPQPDRLDKGSWTVCVTPSGPPRVTLLLGSTTGQPVARDQGLLVAAPDSGKYLVWQGRRYRLGTVVFGALGYAATAPIPVPASWLNSIPAGQDLLLPAIPGVGSPGPVIDGRPSVAGQILQARNPALNADQFFLVLPNGVATLNVTARALLLASPETKKAYPDGNVVPIQVSSGALARVPTAVGDGFGGYPPSPPALINGSLSDATVPCVRSGPSGTDAALLTMPAADVNGRAAPIGRHDAGPLVDRISIPAGSGVLARDLPTPGATAGPEYLITDFGVKFPLGEPSVVGTLGYPDGSSVEVAHRLLALLPTGPVLSPAAALAEQSP